LGRSRIPVVEPLIVHLNVCDPPLREADVFFQAFFFIGLRGGSPGIYSPPKEAFFSWSCGELVVKGIINVMERS